MAGSRPLASVLIVDDDKGIRDTVADFLELEGYQVLQAGNVGEARSQLALKPDLMLLDLKMPGGDGLSFAGEIRRQSSIPIIIISGKGDTVDRVVGLEVGADDYLPKPFELRELLSRIRALLRRSRVMASDTEAEGAHERAARFGGSLVLLPGRRHVVNQEGAVIDLTPQEFNLLAALVERPQRIYDRGAIAGLLRRTDGVDDRNIDALVSRLRRKLNDHVDAQSLIQTVRGEGYVLASEVHWTDERR
jgi:two-component system OmpR family response regulator